MGNTPPPTPASLLGSPLPGTPTSLPAPSLRQRIFTTLNDPRSSVAAMAINVLIQLLILLSVATFILQTMSPLLGPDGEPGSCPAGFRQWAFDPQGSVVGCVDSSEAAAITPRIAP